MQHASALLGEDNVVALKLAERIRREGPIPFTDYMGAVAAAYYAREHVLGAAGDFTTSPEISQTFGELIGLWCAVVWQNMGAPPSFRLVECGPGRGTLIKDFLRATSRVPGFNAAADVHLLEQSPMLKARQKEALAAYKVTWHENVADIPPGPTLLVGNEFLDALPIRQFEKTEAGWAERYVTLDAAGGFGFVLGPPLVESFLDDVIADTGMVFETSPATRDFVAHISARIACDGGAALLIDYGHPQTMPGETLQAVSKHRFCGVFETPGEADLTAHVDFAAIGTTARTAGAHVHGPIAQGLWLNRLGIKLRGLQLAKGKTPDVAKQIESGVRRLIEADAMGMLFKVMALTHHTLPVPDGFDRNADA
jgi:NADH dehydrogenase [ubiquinone] 1 alpha subcomplex assembly factor 7